MDLSPANYSDQEGFFSCGPTAASALACQVEAENLVRCITNAPDRSAISFAVAGETWTVQRSVDKGAPEEVVAETVTFAGT